MAFRSAGDTARLDTSRPRLRARTERQIAQERDAHARYRPVARSHRPVRLRLLQKDSRIGQLGLCGDAFTVPHLGYLIGATGLFDRSRACLPLRLSRFQFRQRAAGVELCELLDLVQSQALLGEIGLGNQHVAADSTAGENGKGEAHAHVPVGPEVAPPR